MSAADVHISQRAADLKRVFDRTFAEAQIFEPVATEDFLSIDVGGDPHMLRLSEIGGLYVDKKITALPSPVAEFKGLAGLRGVMLPVYDLAALLRYPQSTTTRWMVMAAGEPVALTFDAFNGHFRFPRATVASNGNAESGEHFSHVVHTENLVCPVINLFSLIAAIRSRAPVSSMQ